MDTSAHELKEYVFMEKIVVRKVKIIYGAVEAILLLALFAYTVYAIATGTSNLVITLSLLVALVALYGIRGAFEQTVCSTVTLFDTYMIIKRNNIKYGINDTRSENHTIHYNEVDQIIFSREDNTLTINGMDEVIAHKHDIGTKMYVAPPTEYKMDYGSLRIKLANDAYISIAKFITDNTPLSIEIK